MMKSKFMPKVLFLTLLTSISILFITSATAFAEPITGCIQRFTGIITNVQIGTEPKHPCRFGAEQITWNTEGPPGADGAPGADGQDGEDGINGVLLGKGASAEEQFTADGEIYSETSDPVQSTSTFLFAIAYCVDENDIAISGQCFGNTNWSLERAGIQSNDNLDNRASQICIWNKPASDETTAGAQVSCIKVPGP